MKWFVTVEWIWLDVVYPGWHRLNGLSLVKWFVVCGMSVMHSWVAWVKWFVMVA